MQILSLRFKNLNSLVGEFKINFQEQSYEDIFTITGPTGSGKSTILDAICLALYARTPRLDKISTKHNEIMSKQAFECFSEVLFKTKTGTYLCHFSQRRAKNLVAGNLQPQRHEISNLSGEIISNKVSEVKDIVAEVSGLDFSRFTKSVLLAQGEFKAFLEAEDNEKASILEKITKTETYGNISMAIFQTTKVEKEKLETLEKSSLNLTILNEEEEEAILKNLHLLEEKKAKFNLELQSTFKTIEWLENIEKLKTNIKAIELKQNEHLEKLEAFKSQKAKLDLDKKAQIINSLYFEFDNLRKNKADYQSNLTIKEAELRNLTQDLQKQKTSYQQKETELKQAEITFQTELKLFLEVKNLDLKIEELTKNYQTQEALFLNKQKQQKELEQNILDLEKGINDLKSNLSQINNYLEEHNFKDLMKNLSLYQNKVANLKESEININNLSEQKNKLLKSVEKQEKELEKLKIQLTQSKTSLNTELEDLSIKEEKLKELLKNKELDDYLKEKEELLLRKALIKDINDLESYRQKLIDKHECPLCGSKDHPFAKGNIPKLDKYDLELKSIDQKIKQIQDSNKSISQLKERLNQIKESLFKEEEIFNSKDNNLKIEKNNLKQINEQLDKANKELAKLKQGLNLELKQFIILESSPELTLLKLEEKASEYKTNLEKKDLITKEINQKENSLSKDKGHLKPLIESKEQTSIEVKNLKTNLEETQKKRFLKLENKDPNLLEKEKALNLENLKKDYQTSLNLLQSLKEKTSSNNSLIQDLKKRLQALEPLLDKKQKLFFTSLKQQEFIDEQAYLKAQLNLKDKENLTQLNNKLEQETIEIKALLLQKQQDLSDEVAKKLSDQTILELKEIQKATDEQLNKIISEIISLKNTIATNKQNKAKVKEQQKLIEKQKNTYRRWANLDELIGSADGAKYRKFAQGLTFETIVNYANLQLNIIQDRYILKRDFNQPLSLKVIDNYQAGIERSIKTLSGGESFIVSLSLALGLAKMTSKTIQVDSLFLDEGFGTLDEDALDVALDTLANLKKEGKLIGIISHIPQLKDKIAVQINVIPQSGGKSILKGPGISYA